MIVILWCQLEWYNYKWLLNSKANYCCPEAQKQTARHALCLYVRRREETLFWQLEILVHRNLCRETANTNRTGLLESAVHSILTEKCAKKIIPSSLFHLLWPWPKTTLQHMTSSHWDETTAWCGNTPVMVQKLPLNSRKWSCLIAHSHLIHDLQIYQLYSNIITNFLWAFSNRVNTGSPQITYETCFEKYTFKNYAVEIC